MHPELEKKAMELGQKATLRFTTETEIADFIKTEFDREYGEDWHCIVGSKFGSSISPQDGSFIYFTHGKYSILLFK